MSTPILYLSRYIIANKSEYYRRLLAVTSGSEWEPWVLFVLRGVQETAEWTTAKIDAIRQLQQQTAGFVRSKLPKLYTRELVDALFEQPYCRIANLVESQIAKRQTAASYLRQLVEMGVMGELGVGREKFFVNTRLLRLLTRDSNEVEVFPG